jgi:hypothetical protein
MTDLLPISPTPPRSFGKFGKNAPKKHPNTLRLSKYTGPLIPISPTAPRKVFREYKVPPGQWGMLGNDVAGNCTICACAHMLMNETVHTGTIVVPTLAEVMATYSAISGYDPITGANDNGCAMSDVMEYWRTHGLSGHKILAWAQVDYQNFWHVKQAIWLFGGLDIGVNLPQSAMDQFSNGQFWDIVPNDGGIIGGHAIPLFGYGSQGTNCITWGQRQGMTWEWFSRYVDEAYVVISSSWFNEITKQTPSGFDIAVLENDLKSIVP